MSRRFKSSRTDNKTEIDEEDEEKKKTGDRISADRHSLTCLECIRYFLVKKTELQIYASGRV